MKSDDLFCNVELLPKYVGILELINQAARPSLRPILASMSDNQHHERECGSTRHAENLRMIRSAYRHDVRAVPGKRLSVSHLFNIHDRFAAVRTASQGT